MKKDEGWNQDEPQILTIEESLAKTKEMEEKTKRLGWILAELGMEDAKIERLEEELELRKGRRRTLERASKKLTEELGIE